MLPPIITSGTRNGAAAPSTWCASVSRLSLKECRHRRLPPLAGGRRHFDIILFTGCSITCATRCSRSAGCSVCGDPADLERCSRDGPHACGDGVLPRCRAERRSKQLVGGRTGSALRPCCAMWASSTSPHADADPKEMDDLRPVQAQRGHHAARVFDAGRGSSIPPPRGRFGAVRWTWQRGLHRVAPLRGFGAPRPPLLKKQRQSVGEGENFACGRPIWSRRRWLPVPAISASCSREEPRNVTLAEAAW